MSEAYKTSFFLYNGVLLLVHLAGPDRPAEYAELRQGFCAASYAHHYVARAPAYGYKMQVLYGSLIVLSWPLILTLTCITPVIPTGGKRHLKYAVRRPRPYQPIQDQRSWTGGRGSRSC